MNKEIPEKVANAIEILKEFCSASDCNICPLRKEGKCELSRVPLAYPKIIEKPILKMIYILEENK